MAIDNSPSPEVDEAMREALNQFGPFVVDGERWYQSVDGGERIAGKTAQDVNIRLGSPDVPPVSRYSIFKVLYFRGRDLTAPDATEWDRIKAGQEIGAWLHGYCESIEILKTYESDSGKAALVAVQKAEGREGMIFVDRRCTWYGGKRTSEDFVRVKFTVTTDSVILKLPASDKVGRLFTAIECGQWRNGELVSIGSCGTGFTAQDMREIKAAFDQAGPGKVVVEVETRGRTEAGKLWHGGFVRIRADKTPEQCVFDA